MIVGGAILPHPPIILPSYAGERGPEVQGTIDAVRDACRWIAEELRPERLVMSSPHLGHGFEVPLFFLGEALPGLPPVDRVLTDDPSSPRYRVLGERLRADSTAGARLAVIASGDCSHRLKVDGPYGLHPLGPVLDERITACVRAADADCLLGIEDALVDEGAECGLRSFIFALAALRPARARVLSYQAPYGVGYLVATLARA